MADKKVYKHTISGKTYNVFSLSGVTGIPNGFTHRTIVKGQAAGVNRLLDIYQDSLTARIHSNLSISKLGRIYGLLDGKGNRSMTFKELVDDKTREVSSLTSSQVQLTAKEAKVALLRELVTFYYYEFSDNNPIPDMTKHDNDFLEAILPDIGIDRNRCHVTLRNYPNDIITEYLRMSQQKLVVPQDTDFEVIKRQVQMLGYSSPVFNQISYLWSRKGVNYSTLARGHRMDSRMLTAEVLFISPAKVEAYKVTTDKLLTLRQLVEYVIVHTVPDFDDEGDTDQEEQEEQPEQDGEFTADELDDLDL